MRWSLKILSVRGIDIKVHLTFVLILVWAAYFWGINLKGGTTGAVFGIVVTVLLFVCVTLHELAHSFTAMRYGVKVQGITLLPIGGVAQMEEIPEDPAQELKVALAGPLTNIVIALVLIAIYLPFGIRSTVTPAELFQMLRTISWQGLLTYLAMTNVLLGVFNLLPAFPMDGGRVLRALLAMRMDHSRATALAVRIGEALAWGLGIYGLLNGDLFLVLIAVFIYFGAGQEGRMVELKSALEGIRVRRAMTEQFQVLAPDAPISQAVELTLKTFQSDFPVVEGGQLVGLLSEVDLVTAIHERGRDLLVRDVMRTDVPAAAPDDPLFDAHKTMGEGRLRAMPVLADGKLVGLLTAQDVSEAYLLLGAVRPSARGGLQADLP